MTSLTFGKSIKMTYLLVTPEVQPFSTAPELLGWQLLRARVERRCDEWLNRLEALADCRLHLENFESLAFRAFDKILIIGHWPSKTLKLALASRAFLSEKCIYYILSKLFSKSQKYFPNFFFLKWFSKISFGAFSYVWSFLAFLSTLYNFPSHVQT